MDKAARGTGVLALQSGVNALLGTLLFMYAARVLTKTEIGVYGAVTLVSSVTMIIGRLGLNTAASRFIPHLYASENLEGAGFVAKRILSLSTLSASLLSGLCFVFSPLLSKLVLQNQQYAYLFQVASFALFVGILGLMFSAFIQGLQMFSRLALILLASQIMRVTITALLLTLAFRIEALFIGSIAFNLPIIVLALPPTLSRLLRHGSSGFPQPIKPLLSFALPMTGYELVSYVYNSVDQFTVLDLIGVESLGVYAVALTAASLTLTVIAGPLLTTLTPRLSEVHGRVGLTSVANALKPTSRYISLLFIPATLGLAAISPSAIQVLAGQKYLEASLLTVILCLGVATCGFSTMITSALIAAGKTGRVMGIMLSTSIVGLALTVGLTQRFGVLGTASAKALTYGILLALSIHLGSKIMPISFDCRAIGGSLAASTIMAITVNIIASYTSFNLTLLPLYITSGLLVYGLGLSTMRILTLNDVRFISQIIPGGRPVYIRLYKRVNDSRLLSKVARKILN